MAKFSPLRFSAYAQDLSKAIHRLSRETRMSAYELSEAMRGVPGAEGLTVRYQPNGDQHVTMAGRTIEVGPMASNEEIIAALMSPLPTPSAATSALLASSLDIVESTPVPGAKPMSITGLQSGAFAGKLADMRQKIADAQNQGLAKIDGAQVAAAAKVDAAIAGVTAKVDKEVEDALQEFATFTNGGPA